MTVNDDATVLVSSRRNGARIHRRSDCSCCSIATPGRIPRANEEIIAEPTCIDKALQELSDAPLYCPLDRVECCRIILRSNPSWVGRVALEALGAPEAQPARDRAERRRRESQQHLMVSEQENGLGALAAISPQALHDLAESVRDRSNHRETRAGAFAAAERRSRGQSRRAARRAGRAGRGRAHDVSAKTSRSGWPGTYSPVMKLRIPIWARRELPSCHAERAHD